ncbi:MAG: nucleotidyltransferase family protein [Candidatus Asgardarchaeia archaeon]
MRRKKGDKQELYRKIVKILKKFGAKKIAIFGSYIRDEETLKSDIDILVEFSEKKTLLDLVRIERILSEELGIKVDLLTEKSISPYLINQIKQEAMVILE